MVIGDINPHGGYPVESRARESTKVWNYCQIFKESYSFTRTMKQTKFVSGDKPKKLKADALARFNEQREGAYLMGPLSHGKNPENGQDEYTTQGIINFLKSGAPQTIRHFNLLDGSSPYKGQTWDAMGHTFLDESLEMVHHYTTGSVGQKLVLCGNGALGGINRLAKVNSTFQLTSATTTFGWNIRKYLSPWGEVKFLTYPRFSMYPGMSNAMLFLEPQNIKRKVIQKTIHQNVTPKGFDGEVWEYLAEDGLKVRYPKTMMLLTGVGLNNTQQ
jgi:hypothetical protein